MFSAGSTGSGSRPSRFKDLSEMTFNKETYFSTDKQQQQQQSRSPLSPLEGHTSMRKMQSGDTKTITTTTLNVPIEVTSPTQLLLADAPLANSQLVYGAPHIVRSNSPAQLSRVMVSSPRASYIQGGSRMVVGPSVPLTTSVLPPSATITSVHQPVVLQQQSYSPTVTRIETIKEQITHQEKTQIQRLQAMNDFLTENYTLVYEKLKQLENRPHSPPAAPIDHRPPTQQVNCVNDQWLMKSLISKIEHTCDLELESALARFRSINIRQFRSTISSTSTARFS